MNNFVVKPLSVKRGKLSIFTQIYLPEEKTEKYPAVILSHGFGSTGERMTGYAEFLVRHGYAAVVFDFCGGSMYSRSDGSNLDMSIFTEEEDLDAVLQAVKKLDYINTDEIYLCGASQGGVVSALEAADHPEEIKALILLYPAFVLVDDAKKMFPEEKDIPDSYFHMVMTIGKAYALPLLHFDLFSYIKRYTGPVLIIHGSADRIAPIGYSEAAIEVYKNAELKVIVNAPHGFSGKEQSQAEQWMLAFLKKQECLQDSR